MNFVVDVLVSDLQTIEICFVFEGDYPACVSVFCLKQNKKNSRQTKHKNLKHNSNNKNFIFHFLRLIKISPL